MKPNLGIADKDREEVVKLLTGILADEFVIYTKTRNYHWNVLGLEFNDLHQFFQTQYEELNHIVDDVAERGRTIGGKAIGTLEEFLKHTRLKEEPGSYPDAPGMLSTLLADHESVVRQLRKDLEACAEQYNDMGTSDFLTGLLGKHEKMAWMLRSFVK